ncbi:MAG: hypothetical protein HY063_05570 [Bacteroidetes bacterium]|nr:hypothetical protein [Bacteroidota bacterium]
MKTIFRTLSLISLFLIPFYFLSSCCKPGTGGDATLVVFLQHHTKPIINHVGWPDTVFVKFKAKDSPGTSPGNYDTYFIGEQGEDHVHCKGLKCGDYFLFGAGYDSINHERVTGGLHVKIKHKERKQETDVDLPVSE